MLHAQFLMMIEKVFPFVFCNAIPERPFQGGFVAGSFRSKLLLAEPLLSVS